MYMMAMAMMHQEGRLFEPQGQQLAGDVVPLKIAPGSSSKPSSEDGDVIGNQRLLQKQWEKAPKLSPTIGQSFKGQG
jgi:hypothetical protein